MIPTSGFAHLQNSGVHSDQKTQQGDLSISEPETRSFADFRTQFAHAHARS